jgi:PAS domain S-box-containing protein
MDSLQFTLAAGAFMPHGYCYLWQSNLVGLHIASDAFIALAYYLIAAALLYFVQRSGDVPFQRLFWLFALFIAACGTTHLLEIWTLWFPTYWLSGGMKAITAVVSVWTAAELIPRIPIALSAPNAFKVEALSQSLQQATTQRKAAESDLEELIQTLEQRVIDRTRSLQQAKVESENQLQREKAVRAELEITLQNLQVTTERLNVALDAAQMGSWDWYLEQQQLYWSPKTEEIMGYASGTANPSYEDWAARVHPDDLPRIEAAIAHTLQTQELLAEEYRLIWPDQSLHWVVSQGRLVQSSGNEEPRLVGTIHDISAAKQAELAVRVSESRFRSVFEQAAVGMARLCVEGRWLQVNETFCNLLGYTADELIGKTFQSITDPGDGVQDEHYYRQLLQSEIDSCRFEKRYLHKDGTPIWTTVTVSTERIDNDEITAFIAVIEDTRELKQTLIELQVRAIELENVNSLLALTTAGLRDRNAELDQFAYIASHDLKAPLRAIANLSEWIEEDLGGQIPKENQHQLVLMRNRVHRMEGLINGLLEYSRVGRQARDVESVAVDQLLAGIIDSLAPPEGFTVSVLGNMPTLTTNRTALGQVFSNLISNAIKHHDCEDGCVQITAQDQGKFVQFVVRDDGPGIDPKYHQKVFAIFQTLKARDELECTGIGLSIVRKIIEAEGGEITLKSALGEGSTFQFTWPR